MAVVGRKSKLHQELTRLDRDGQTSTVTYEQAVLEALRAGAFVNDAAEACGLHESTIHEWIGRGQKFTAAVEESAEVEAVHGRPRAVLAQIDADLARVEREEPFAQFAEAATRARANAVVFALERITADPDWRASAWYLERTRPKRYAKRVEVDTDPGDRTPAEFDHEQARKVEQAMIDAGLPEELAGKVLMELPR